MKTVSIFSGLLLTCFAVMAQGAEPVVASAPLSALITHEARQTGNDGVERSSRYQERYLRDVRNVWIERVLPAQHRHESEHGHEHLDMAEAAQHYTRDARGKTTLVMVLQEEKTRVTMHDADVDMSGLNTCWPCLYSIVQPETLKTMTVKRREGSMVWYEKKSGGNTVSVQWDEKLQIAREMEAMMKDGSWSRTRLTLQKAPALLPWTQYGKFALMDYSDFGD